MLRIIAFGDLEANIVTFTRISDLNLDSYDCAVFTGDIPNPEIFRKLSKQMVESGLGDLGDKPNIARETEPEWALKQVEGEFRAMDPLFTQINEKTKLIGVWGNAYNTKMLNRVPLDQHITIIHNRVFQLGDYTFIGYNGRPLYIYEKENKEQWAFAEDELYTNLDNLLAKLKGHRVVLVTHAPPYGVLDKVADEYRQYAIGTYGDRANDGHIGSTALRRIVDKHQPILHIFGHIHEGKGILVKQTVFVNTGGTGHDNDVVEISIDRQEIEVRFKKVF